MLKSELLFEFRPPCTTTTTISGISKPFRDSLAIVSGFLLKINFRIRVTSIMHNFPNHSPLRVTIRQHEKSVMKFIDENYVTRINGRVKKPQESICLFCASNKQITREHLIPRWAFQKSTEAYFNITVNGLDQTYNRATIPACSSCNNNLLNALERSIQELFTNRDVNSDPFDPWGIEEIIRWLELIDYKFQLFNITRQFKYSKSSGDIPYLRDFPLYMILSNKQLSPFQVLTSIRKSLKRLSIKNKYDHLNSLVIFKTKNPNPHFFHTIDEFIFMEMPQYQIALFYFYRDEFDTIAASHERAMEIIKSVY